MLTINNIRITGLGYTQFEIYEDKFTGKVLKKGKSCEVKVKFKPTSAELKEANLEIDSDSPTNPIQDATLKGTGYIK